MNTSPITRTTRTAKVIILRCQWSRMASPMSSVFQRISTSKNTKRGIDNRSSRHASTCCLENWWVRTAGGDPAKTTGWSNPAGDHCAAGQVGDLLVSVGRTQPTRYVRYEAQCAGYNSQPLQTDRDSSPRHPGLRASARDGEANGPRICYPDCYASDEESCFSRILCDH